MNAAPQWFANEKQRGRGPTATLYPPGLPLRAPLARVEHVMLAGYAAASGWGAWRREGGAFVWIGAYTDEESARKACEGVA